MPRFVGIVFILFLVQGCSMWPYKSDFACPMPEGEKCRSLYEVNKMADEGKYAPENKQEYICRGYDA